VAENYKKLYQGQPGTAAATIYTVPALTTTLIKTIKAVNATTATAATIGLFHDGLVAANRTLPDLPLNPGEFLVDDTVFMLETGDTLAAIASVAATITVTVYGVEIV
jgi:hypothetical protein